MKIHDASPADVIKHMDNLRKKAQDKRDATLANALRHHIRETTPGPVNFSAPSHPFREFASLLCRIWLVGILVAIIALVLLQVVGNSKAEVAPGVHTLELPL